jgi:hypothetical protein
MYAVWISFEKGPADDRSFGTYVRSLDSISYISPLSWLTAWKASFCS